MVRQGKLFHVRKQLLLAIAGGVWLAAGFNVARLGILAYAALYPVHWFQVGLSLIVFCLFGGMFYKMSQKHSRRIQGYPQETRPFWHFFDGKAYAIMALMMGGGMWLRFSGLVSEALIAVFYTGLGCALAMAGVVFLGTFVQTLRAPAAHRECPGEQKK